MEKRKRKLTSTEKAEKKRRQKEYMTIFINGKQKRIKRPPPTTDIGSPIKGRVKGKNTPLQEKTCRFFFDTLIVLDSV